MQNVQLNTGIELPIVGSGTNTFGKVDHGYSGEINGDTTEIEDAIAVGYRHFDTAISYRNEAVLGKAIAESDLPREEFFITSKIPGKPEYTENRGAIEAAIQSSLDALQTDYIDLYLVHHPWDNLDEIISVWKVLEDYVDKGVFKAIGVSNFDEEQLAYVIRNARIKPAVNQVQSHPGLWNHEIIEYGQEQGVVAEAWGPLSRISDEAKDALEVIGDKYDKSWAQVILRYQIQRNVIVIPKSHNKERQQQNLELFDFELTAPEQVAISQLN